MAGRTRYRAWKHDLVVETLQQAKLECEVAPLIDAHGAGRRRITLHARLGTHDVLKVGFAAAGSHDVIPSIAARSSIPVSTGALDAAWALAEPLTKIGKPLDIQVTATSNGLDIDVRGSGPLTSAMITTLSRVAEKHRLARLTRHGELVLMRNAPDCHDRHRAGDAAAGLVPAGDDGGRRGAGGAGRETCGRAKHIADLFCGVGPFALRLARRRASRPSTATPARSPRCRRPRPRHPG